jgi:APA family basic amino acid/polyamine antiporter
MTQIAGASENGQAGVLQRTISPFRYVVFGFGSIVGTAWVVLLGGWLKEAGPGGTLVGIALGGAATALIAAMYAELASRFPRTGGEVTFVNAVFGKKFGFIVGWLLTLAYLSGLTFEGVAVAWLLGILWPPITGPIIYSILGQPVGLGGLLAALVCCVTITALNYRGARSFVKFQNILTGVFLLIVLVTVAFELYFGSAQNIHPLWRAGDGGSWLIGAAWVFGSAPFLLNGFQCVLHAIEERSQTTSKELVVRLAIVAVGTATAFYLLVVLAAAKAAPWTSIVSSELPAVAALAHLPWSRALTTALLVALVASVLKTWTSVFMVVVRLLFAQARDGMIPAFFGSVNAKTGSPDRAVIVVGLFNFVGLFFGKGVLEPIANTVTLCIAMIYVLCCAAALVMRRREPAHVGFRVPGGTPVAILAIGSALAMAVFALLQPADSTQANLFKWVLLSSWAVIGLSLYRLRNRSLPARPPISGGEGEPSRSEVP